MKRILVPTDYSETADHALKCALHTAGKKEIEIYVLHVYNPPVISGGISPELVTSVNEKYYQDELNLIEENKKKLSLFQKQLGITNVKIISIIKDGILIDEIIHTIEKYQIDYIFMGTDGQSSFQKKLFGTNTIKTIDSVKIPVLCVPKETVFKTPERVMYLTAYAASEEKNMDFLAQKAKEKGMAIKCVHLRQEETDQAAYLRWKEKYSAMPVSFHNFTSGKSLVKSLLTYIEKETIDLVSITHKQRHFFEKFFSDSITVQIGRRLGVPLLVFQHQP